jgi:hypothetical protein
LLDQHDTRLLIHYVEQAHVKSDWSALRRIAVDEHGDDPSQIEAIAMDISPAYVKGLDNIAYISKLLFSTRTGYFPQGCLKRRSQSNERSVTALSIF